MRIEILTIFPALFESFLNSSLISKAIERDLIRIAVTNVRDFSEAPHHKVDDEPFGGGAGMVMKPEPLSLAIEAAKAKLTNPKAILLSPSGSIFKQASAKQLSTESDLIFICGRYEGVDQRVIDKYVDLELSVGDYVVMGGEVPCMLVIEAITRLIPEVLGNSESIEHESFSKENLLESPQYTRPAEYKGDLVPDILLSGDHKKIAAWRKEQSILKTKKVRPDLLNGKN